VRWYNVGSFLALAPVGRAVILVAFNNPPVGPDRRTTPFCRWVHGRVVSVSRARQQVDAYVGAALEGDVEGMLRAWPLLSDEIAHAGSTAGFQARFASLGLGPYHWGCRTETVAQAQGPVA
jgi:hypothetical protein